MGTTYQITIHDFNGNRENIKFQIDDMLDSINDIFSTYITNSEISLINKSTKSDGDIISASFVEVLT